MQVYGDGESAPELTREPKKEDIGAKRTYYDSVQVCGLAQLVFCGNFTLLTCNYCIAVRTYFTHCYSKELRNLIFDYFFITCYIN